MNYQLSRRILFLCGALFAIHPVTKADEGISVSPSASNNYVIPPGHLTNSISFNVTVTGPFIDMPYRYKYSIDGGSPTTVSLPGGAFMSNPYQTSFGVNLGCGYHSVSVILERLNVAPNDWGQRGSTAYTNVSLTQNHSVTVQNSFDGGAEGGGFVTVDWIRVPSGTPYTWPKFSNHSVFASDGGTTHNGYTQQFVNWSGFGAPVENIIYYFDVVSDANYTANYDRVLYVYFQNNFAGAGNGGDIIVRGQQYSSPTYALSCTRTLSITGQAFNQPYNGLEYVFSSWSPGGSISASTSFYPQDDVTTCTANFVFSKPQPPTSVQAGGAVGQNVTVTWVDNPNTAVTQYQIWRQPKNQASQYVVSVSSGIGSWTDYSYKITGTGSDGMLFYYVYSVYAPTGALSDPATAITTATKQGPEPKLVGGNGRSVLWGMNETPREFAVSNYPNPFNPSTTISYRLAKDASVKLEIYDVMGRKLRSLVDENRSAGYYSVVWNGRDEMGREVASGTYLYRFTATPINGENAFKQSGKLLLTR